MQSRQHYSNDERKRWMDVLARSNPERLRDLYRGLKPKPCYDLVDRHETAIDLYPGTLHGRPSRTRMTRCVVRLASGVTGLACLPGRSRRHAEIAAVFDALLKEPDRYDELIGTVIDVMAHDVSREPDSFSASAIAVRRA